MSNPNPPCGELFDDEKFWRDRYHFFKERGYILRPRYHPEWEPPWRFDVDSLPNQYEDAIFQMKPSLLDARKDGKDVFIKRVDSRTNPTEVRIASRLGSSESRKYEQKHCVPVLSVFPDDRDPNYQYIVMPILRPFYDPNFTSVGEAIDFVDQVLEVVVFPDCTAAWLTIPQGLVFIHDQHVAHRDCADRNILMDGSNIYKNGWHPMEYWRARDGRTLFQSRKRSEVEIRYYFIDFGLSSQFLPEQRERLVTGELGRITAPEQRTGLPYDPFKLDVYDLGYVFQTKIINEFKGLDILDDLALLMTKSNPAHRPSAREALRIWEGLRSLPSVPPRWSRLRSTQEEGSFERIVNDALDMVDRVRESIGL